MAWSAGLFTWSLNHLPPLGYPVDLDADADNASRVDEHMTVVLLALALYHVARLEKPQWLAKVTLARLEVEVGRAAQWLAEVQPESSQPGGRLRQADRDRIAEALGAPGQIRLQRWQDTAIAVIRGHQAAGEVVAEDDNRQFGPLQPEVSTGTENAVEELDARLGRGCRDIPQVDMLTVIWRYAYLSAEMDFGWYAAISNNLVGDH